MIGAMLPEHMANTALARELYQDNLNSTEALADWRFAVRDARKAVGAALRASKFLTDIAGALEINNGHSLVFRHVIAPPVSQDQFKILCKPWSKSAENNGKPAKPAAAAAVQPVVGPGRLLAHPPYSDDRARGTARDPDRPGGASGAAVLWFVRPP